ncbi:MAG: GAF domain-containing protein [Calditrichaceae bacterium]|nr:GAF domain-containing protein [Calditrichaceae bacterium]
MKHVKNYQLHLWIILINSLILISGIFAQSVNYKFDEITIDDGLSQSTVFSIVQDHTGYLWIGTQDGLNRYDGRNIKIYLTDNRDSTSLSDTWISKIIEDKFGCLWIGTQSGGLNCYTMKNDAFKRFMHNPDDPGSIVDNSILDIFIDSKERMWVCTGKGVNLYNRDKSDFRKISFDEAYQNQQKSTIINLVYEDSLGNLWVGTSYGLGQIDTAEFKINYNLDNYPALFELVNFNITTIVEDRKDNLWIGTESSGAFRYNLSNQTLKHFYYDPSNKSSLSSNKINKIVINNQDKVWIGTDDGLNIYNSSRKGFTVLRSDPSDFSTLNSSQILDIYQDKSGIMWIGCFAGAVNKYDQKSSVFEHYVHDPTVKNSLVYNDVWAFAQDKSGMIWIGTNKGLSRFNPKNKSFASFRHDPRAKNSLSHDVVRVVIADKKNRIWLGTDGGGLNLYDPKRKNFTLYQHYKNDPSSVSSDAIRALYEDSDGYIWIGTWDGLDRLDVQNGDIVHYKNIPDIPNSLSDNRIRSLYETRDKKLWIGTYGGLNCFDRETDSVRSYQFDRKNRESLSNDRVLCILEDQRGILWVGTFSGLNRFDRNKDTFTVFKMKDGLPNDVIYGIVEDQEGYIWVSTNRGLSKFDPRLDVPVFRNFNVLDGLQSNEFNGGAYLKTSDGELYFGGINGFNKFNPLDITRNESIPNVVITDFKIFDKSIPNSGRLNSSSKISLSYEDHYFSIEFAALDFTNPLKNQYAYRMDGLDDQWIECGNRRFVSYTNLNGGTYTFYVRGSNNDEVWNPEPAVLEIYIQPPFWQTWWFQVSGILALVLIIFGYSRSRINRGRELRFRLEKEVNQRTIELKTSNESLVKAQREAQRMFSQAALLNEVGQRISSELDLNTLLNEIVTSVQGNFGYYNVMLLMVEEENKGLRLQSIAGGCEDIFTTELVVPNGEGMIGQAAFTQKTQLSNDVSTNQNFIRKGGELTKSELSIPIFIGNEIFGVLDIQSDELNAFDEADVNALETFSTQIASAINNARLYEKSQKELHERSKAEEALRKSRDTLLKAQREMHRRSTQAALLYEVGQRISSTLDLDILLNEIVASARDAFDYFNVMLLLYDAKKQGVSLKSISGGFEKSFPADLFLKLGEGMIGVTAKEKQTQLSNDISLDKNYVSKENDVTKSELSVPILNGAELIGVLDIQSDKTDAFDDVDVSTLETFSTQIAAAMTNANLYIKAQEELKERERAEQRLRESLESLESAKKDTDDIFQNIEEGLYLLNRDGAIGSQYSKSLEKILAEENLADRKLIDLLRHKIPDATMKSSQEFLSLMFREDVDEDMVRDLNPISEIELNFVDKKKVTTSSKFLSFKFKRIYDKTRKISGLICTIRDITGERSLAQQLEESEIQQKKQMEWMLSVLHIEAPLLQEFISGVKRELNTIDSSLQSSRKQENYAELLEEIYRSMHIIKGNSALLDLKFFTQSAHEFEEVIEQVREKKEISGSDFVPLILRLSDIRKMLKELEGLAERISQIHNNFRPKRSYESDLFKRSLANMVANLSRDMNKNAVIEMDEFDPNAIPFHYRLGVKEILIQLIRNSLHHGIETPDERKKVKKTLQGKLSLTTFTFDNRIGLKFRDDGRGIQMNKLKEKALADGKWKASELEKWDRSKIVNLIFEHGLSTSEKANHIAGRGVGMDIIKEKIKNMEGTIEIQFEENKFTEFVITLPSNRKRY